MFTCLLFDCSHPSRWRGTARSHRLPGAGKGHRVPLPLRFPFTGVATLVGRQRRPNKRAGELQVFLTNDPRDEKVAARQRCRGRALPATRAAPVQGTATEQIQRGQPRRGTRATVSPSSTRTARGLSPGSAPHPSLPHSCLPLSNPHCTAWPGWRQAQLAAVCRQDAEAAGGCGCSTRHHLATSSAHLGEGKAFQWLKHAAGNGGRVPTRRFTGRQRQVISTCGKTLPFARETTRGDDMETRTRWGGMGQGGETMPRVHAAAGSLGSRRVVFTGEVFHDKAALKKIHQAHAIRDNVV